MSRKHVAFTLVACSLFMCFVTLNRSGASCTALECYQIPTDRAMMGQNGSCVIWSEEYGEEVYSPKATGGTPKAGTATIAKFKSVEGCTAECGPPIPYPVTGTYTEYTGTFDLNVNKSYCHIKS